ncbi:hypothetical protein M8J77_021207 [Diaphorina citri]|nr:hypothetical protein M8J77_021207 [Diaphorina citri]
MAFGFCRLRIFCQLRPTSSVPTLKLCKLEWLRISKIELNRNANVCRELRDFFNKITPCGAPYQQWCAELRQEFPVLNKDPDLDGGEDLEETDREYCQFGKFETITSPLQPLWNLGRV